MKITSVLTGMIVWAWSWLGRLERSPSSKRHGAKNLYRSRPKKMTYPSESQISNPRNPSWVSMRGTLNVAPRPANSAARTSGSGA
jgi:hypothetical protein